MVTYYKFLNGREATHVPGFRYRLRVWQAPVTGPLIACENGYHVLRANQVAGDFIAPDLFVAEVRGDTLDASDKLVAREARIVEHLAGWNERTARLFATDCAERVLPIFEREHLNDDRPRLVIQATRDYANGLIDSAAWAAARAAAWAAAWAAVRGAAWAAAWAAAWTAQPEWDAARSSTRVAARAASWAAARTAVRYAAWDAAKWDAVRYAEWEAARGAAWAAEWKWQSARLLDYAYGRLS